MKETQKKPETWAPQGAPSPSQGWRVGSGLQDPAGLGQGVIGSGEENEGVITPLHGLAGPPFARVPAWMAG